MYAIYFDILSSYVLHKELSTYTANIDLKLVQYMSQTPQSRILTLRVRT